MSFLHHYYTSSRTGTGGGQGFQTYSLSEGVTEQEKDEIELRGTYEPPFGLPQVPSAEEIASEFPKAFQFYQLQSGRFVVSLSQYIGKDYSGRYGNYFCHTVLFEKNIMRGSYPAEYFGSPMFKERLTEEEEQSTATPKPLPATEYFAKSNTVTRTNVFRFLREGNRWGMLRDLIAAVIHYPKSKRRVILIDSEEHLPYWFAALGYAFPPSLALHVTFTTYTQDPFNCRALVCGVYEKEYPSASWNQQFSVFNCIHPSLVHAEKSEYADEIIRLIKAGIDSAPLYEFLSFIEKMKPSAINIGLDDLVHSYNFTILGPRFFKTEGHTRMNDVERAVDAFNRLSDEKVRASLTDILIKQWGHDENVLAEFSLDVHIPIAEDICEWWFQVAHYTQQEKHMKLAVSFFFRTCTQFLIDDENGANHRAILLYYQKIMKKNESSLSFHRLAFHSQRFEEVYLYVKTAASERALLFFLTDFIAHARKLNLDWRAFGEKERSFVLSMTNIAIERRTNIIAICNELSVLKDTYTEILAILFNYYRDKGLKNSETLLMENCLSTVLQSERDNDLLELLAANESIQEGFKRVIESYLTVSKVPATDFNKIDTKLLSQSASFEGITEHVALVASERVLMLPSTNEVLREAEQFLSSRAPAYLSNRELTSWVWQLEQSLPFREEVEDFKELLDILDKEKEYFNIKTKPDITKLLKTLMDSEAPWEHAGRGKGSLEEELARLQDDQYSGLLSWKMPVWLQQCKNDKEQFVRLLKSIHAHQHESIIFKQVIVPNGREVKQEKVLAAYTSYIFQQNECLPEEAVEYFKRNRSLFKKIHEDISKERKFRTIQAAWEPLRTQILEKQEGALLGKVKSLLKIGKKEESS